MHPLPEAFALGTFPFNLASRRITNVELHGIDRAVVGGIAAGLFDSRDIHPQTGGIEIVRGPTRAPTVAPSAQDLVRG